MNTKKDAIKAFIERTTKNEDFDIILTGAGTSEFVGNSIFPYFLFLSQTMVLLFVFEKGIF